MRYINSFSKFSINELLNLSKKRIWPLKKSGKWDYSDNYFVYHLSKDERGKYLNTWFTGVINKSKDDKYTYTDEKITLKKCDEDTAHHLYGREYNTVTVKILCPPGAKFTQNEKKQDLYEMKAQIHSIDDSSYGIWWHKRPFSEMDEIRIKVMEWVNKFPIINGEEFLDYCVSIGANNDTRDYN